MGGMLAALLAVYGQLGGADFVAMDDSPYVTKNPMVNQGFSWAGIVWAFADAHFGHWLPLTWLSFMLDGELFGLDAGGYHWHNLLWHAVNGVLLLLLLKRWGVGVGAAGVIVGLFALHPLHVESVAWVAERKDVLFLAFALMALLAYDHALRARADASAPPALRGTALFYALALMAKPMAVTLPALLVLLDGWPYGRFARESLWRVIWQKWPLWLLAAAYSILMLLLAIDQKAAMSFESLPLIYRAQHAFVAYAAYLKLTFLPLDLSFYYAHPGKHALWLWSGAAALLAAVTVAAYLLRRRAPWALMGWLWFVGTLLPVIGLNQAGAQAYADRFVYLPHIGLFVAIVLSLQALAARWSWGPRAAAAVSAAALTLCGGLAWDQASAWRDNETIVRRSIAATPGNPWLHYLLAQDLRSQKRYDEAVPEFERAVALYEPFDEAHLAFGRMLMKMKREEQAREHFDKAIQYADEPARMRDKVAGELGCVGHTDDAVALLEQALKEDPTLSMARLRLGITLAMSGRYMEALPHLRQAHKEMPDSILPPYHLGRLMNRVKAPREALGLLTPLLDQAPEDANIQTEVALALARLGDRQSAQRHVDAALKIDPEHALANKLDALLNGRPIEPLMLSKPELPPRDLLQDEAE
ncbi:hypothetical protein MAIT1_01396 [Magnetofaba australis IT-1]|uniref:Uncharacterized protein n=1 Tax=Magnetofaba australis IT-1 TaxID=1434232 RepID=A0A1Y2K1D2_9PROT|nr:hypothetical protein MAIT1_01396 [Magnetofaba australis IT-1]